MIAPAPTDYKEAAIEQWTHDPCGSGPELGEPGSRRYFEQLLASREAYAPWMDEALGYGATAGVRILDVGCGQGIDVVRYAVAGADVTGVDLTPRHVELARAHVAALGLSAEVMVADAESLPFGDGTFDRVSSNGVLHHTPDMPRALAEIRRVLRPGGDARLIVYNRNSFHYWINQVLGHGILQGRLLKERSMRGVLTRVEYSRIDARPLVRVYTAKRLARLLRAAGFGGVHCTIRHFNAQDTFVTNALERFVPALRDRAVLDRIGRVGGWYIVARGFRDGVAPQR